MFLNKLSKSFLYAICDILELYTCSLIENCVRAFNIILTYMYYYNTITKIKHKKLKVSLTDSETKCDQLITCNAKNCQIACN